MSDKSYFATDQLRDEIHRLIIRYGQESDLTVYQALGVMELVKYDVVELLELANKRKDNT